MSKIVLKGPVWLMQPIPYFGEEFKGDWIVEPKIDGWRLQVIKSAGGASWRQVGFRGFNAAA